MFGSFLSKAKEQVAKIDESIQRSGYALVLTFPYPRLIFYPLAALLPPALLKLQHPLPNSITATAGRSPPLSLARPCTRLPANPPPPPCPTFLLLLRRRPQLYDVRCQISPSASPIARI